MQENLPQKYSDDDYRVKCDAVISTSTIRTTARGEACMGRSDYRRTNGKYTPVTVNVTGMVMTGCGESCEISKWVE